MSRVRHCPLPHVYRLRRRPLPPPFDGQTLATELSARLLNPVFDVRRIDTQVLGEVHSLDWAVSSGRVRRYLAPRGRLREALTQAPGAPVLRHAILPTALGHWRDVLATLPAIGPAPRSTP